MRLPRKVRSILREKDVVAIALTPIEIPLFEPRNETKLLRINKKKGWLN